MRIVDLYWAAGFLEGEGCFQYHARCPEVTAVQVQREPLERLVRLFGGRVRIKAAATETHQEQHVWKRSGSGAAGLMMTLYSMMSPRRRSKIRECLEIWKATPRHPRFWTACPSGHPYTPENTMIQKGHRRCVTCHRRSGAARTRRYRAAA